MGALLLSLLGSIGIISSGAGATASATTLSLEEIVITESIIMDKWLSTIPEGVNLDIWL
ncbi:hypothetical protein [Spiroplasma poulsonii]|uniref:hypothetical protein n=1 Tax=Spiroplasma poulsonii TaxID=2138 RepID=UPI00131A13A2|nr:hypothetical protein [Spiroplasma poulsonii]